MFLDVAFVLLRILCIAWHVMVLYYKSIEKERRRTNIKKYLLYYYQEEEQHTIPNIHHDQEIYLIYMSTTK